MTMNYECKPSILIYIIMFIDNDHAVKYTYIHTWQQKYRIKIPVDVTKF